MDKQQIVKWRRFLFRTVQGLDRRLRPASPAFSAGMVLAGVAVFGTSAAVLSEVTGFSEGYIRRVVARLRKSRLLRGETLRVRWEHGDHGDIAFICDLLIATGEVVRRAEDVVIERGRRQRAERRAEGQCINCGRARDGEQQTCSRCRASSVASATRRKARETHEGIWTPQLKMSNPRYAISGQGEDRQVK